MSLLGDERAGSRLHLFTASTGTLNRCSLLSFLTLISKCQIEEKHFMFKVPRGPRRWSRKTLRSPPPTGTPQLQLFTEQLSMRTARTGKFIFFFFLLYFNSYIQFKHIITIQIYLARHLNIYIPRCISLCCTVSPRWLPIDALYRAACTC